MLDALMSYEAMMVHENKGQNTAPIVDPTACLLATLKADPPTDNKIGVDAMPFTKKGWRQISNRICACSQFIFSGTNFAYHDLQMNTVHVFSVYEFKEQRQNGTLHMNTDVTLTDRIGEKITDSVQMNKSYLLFSLLRTVGLSGFVP
jgi:hypothetical protein